MKDQEIEPIHIACANGHINVVAYILAKSKDVNQTA